MCNFYQIQNIYKKNKQSKKFQVYIKKSMKEDILFDKNQKLEQKKQNYMAQQKSLPSQMLKKQLSQLCVLTKRQQQQLGLLQKQLIESQLQIEILDTSILRNQLQYETLKLQNLQRKHSLIEEFQKQEQQNQMEMQQWIQQVQKYNGLGQEQIEQLISMEYQGNLGDTEICLSCYKEMQNGNQIKYLPCSHIFHSKCIDEHLQISKVCPACMEQVII